MFERGRRWLLWRWGLKGPSPCILRYEAMLDEHDQRTALGSPIELKPEEFSLSFTELERLYPPPVKQDYPDKVTKPPKKKEE
jgi:hypothetical protein